ncbi:hypothetical protein R6Q57_023526 [Mikania cordata]
MADSKEVYDQVDFQDDNYEEMDDHDDGDVEKQFEEGGDNDDAGGNGEQHEEFSGEDYRGKHAKLLALPQHGYELVFSDGLLRYVVEEDLSELCEPFGHVVEVSFSIDEFGRKLAFVSF